MRYFLSLSLLLLALIADARKITPDEALAAAQDFFNNATTEQKNISRAPCAYDLNSAQPDDDVPYYIFNASGNNGFVIISGDDRMQKILGYSDTGCFDSTDMPPQLKEILNGFSRQLKSLSYGATHNSWKVPVAKSNSGSKYLKTADWGQGAPFNSKIDGEVAGCVATAMGIVMQYYSWPRSGRGSSSSENGTSFDYTTLNIDWNNIPLTTAEFENNAKASSDVADLMRSLWTAVDMQYMGAMGAGAYADRIYYALYLWYKFKMPEYREKAYSYPGYKKFSDDEWESLLKCEIDSDRPVIYSGSDPSNLAGHTFVVDGYDSDNLFHVNWGWDGINNGYFSLRDLTDYPNHHSAVYALEPDYNATDVVEKVLVNGSPDNSYGLNIDFENLYWDGVKYSAYLTGLHEFDKWRGQYALAFIDKDLRILQLACDEDQIRTGTSDFTPYHSSGASWWGVYVDHPASATAVAVVKRDTESEPWQIVPTTGDAVNIAPLDGSKTVYSTLVIDNPDNVPLSFGQNYFGYVPDLNKMLLGSWYSVTAENVSGTVKFYLDGEDFTLYDESKKKASTVVGAHTETTKLTVEFIPGNDFTADIDGLRYVLNTAAHTVSVTHKDTPYRFAKVSIPASVEYDGELYTVNSIGNEAFENSTDLSSIVIPNTVESISYEAFNGSGLSMITFETHSKLKTIGFGAFYNTNLTAIELPEGLEEIESYNFCYQNITKLDIPASVTRIGDIFHSYGQATKKDVYVHWDDPSDLQIDENAFDESSVNPQFRPYCTLYVPYGTSGRYRGALPWSHFDSIIEGDFGGSGLISTDGNPSADIYNIQGVCLKRNATSSDLQTLPAGLYIFNGKKVCVRRY